MDSREYYSSYGDACGAVKVGLGFDRQLLSLELPSESDSTEMEIDKEIKILYHLLSIIYEFVQRSGSSMY